MKRILLLALVAMVGLTACGTTTENASVDSAASISDETTDVSDGETTDDSVTEETTETSDGNTSDESVATDKIADASEMTTVEEVVEEGMVPVAADALKDGDYNVVVDSSSSMFSIENAVLHVASPTMTATMTMSGTGYLYVYMGTGEEAANAPKEDLISYEENADESHSFTVPVEALDQGLPCAAFSKRKEQWYDRTLVFRADSLPADAFLEERGTAVSDLSLADGSYTAEVTLTGGSGKASVTSPAAIRIENGAATATIEWSSPNYDYMIIDGEKYLPVNTDGNSMFEIPVDRFDTPLSVAADTTAMSKPHEIKYTLEFASDSITKK